MLVNFGLWVKRQVADQWRVRVSRVIRVTGNKLMCVMFVSTLVRAGRVRVEFFQPVRVMGRVVSGYFLQL